MLTSRENIEMRRGRERSIAVAIDKDKTSQSALIWAVDNLASRDGVIKLVHVKQTTPLSLLPAWNEETTSETDAPTMELFLSFRCYCRRRQVQCETLLLEDSDVAKALVEYIFQSGIDTFLLGAGSRNGLSRLFKTSDIPSTVLKRAPNYCTVYVVSKGKISSLRSATRPAPMISATGVLPRNSIAQVPSSIEMDSLYDELSTHHVDGFDGSERFSSDTAFFAFYENLGQSPKQNLRRDLYVEETDLESVSSRCRSVIDSSPTPEFKSFDSNIDPTPELKSFDSNTDSLIEQNEIHDDDEEETIRLKTQLKQTMDMYLVACKEALAAKHKVMEVEEWKMREEKRIKEAHLVEETAMQMVEKERAKCRAANEAAEAAQKLVEIEIQKRIEAEMRALKEAEEKKKLLDALGQSHIASKDQSLFHITVVFLVFYFYFSLFR